MSKTSTKPPILMDFGDCVRQYRTERGYSQEAFADACEIDRSYMGGVERGERNLALINIIRIVQTLEMEPSEFFKGLDSGKRRELQAIRQSDQERKTLLKRFKTPKAKKPADAL
jgi:transcriptional regulator with XRE-family HTH domain